MYSERVVCGVNGAWRKRGANRLGDVLLKAFTVAVLASSSAYIIAHVALAYLGR